MRSSLRLLFALCVLATIPISAAAQSNPESKMKLLLISNSTKVGEPYLDYPKNEIKAFLGDKPVTVLVIPYAPVKVSPDELEAMIKPRLKEIGHDAIGIQRFADPVKAVNEAQAIMVSGGNTFKLLHDLRANGLLEPIRAKVRAGTPYIGWSAGSNIAGPTIMTTNDMPIIDPKGLQALDLVPFQLNPHYLDGKPEGYAGEGRDDRLKEYVHFNRDRYVVGLPEQNMLRVEGGGMRLIGSGKVRVFGKGPDAPPRDLGAGDDLSFLLAR